MGEQDYTKRELDTKFEHHEEKMQEGFKDIMSSIEHLKTEHLAPILAQTKLTNGRVNGLETREAERKGTTRMLWAMSGFIATVLIAYLSWLGLQVINIHQEVQKAVTDALLPYAK